MRSIKQVNMVTSPVNDSPLDATNHQLKAALAEFKTAADRDYYDEKSDRQAQETYYQLDANLNPSQLYQALQELVSRTHTQKLSYQPSSQLYPWVDLRPDLKIESIYSKQELDPVQLIEEDFRVQTLRTMHTQTLHLKQSLSEAERQHRIDLLEASLPFNCEHTVPQSWFRKKEPMRGDLHHLFACEINCNSFRGNNPYFDFPDFNKTIRSSCGKLEGGKFEPGANKGTVARAVLYFLLRYPGEINKTDREYQADRLTTLFDWHQAQPAGEYEKHRNAAIFEKQGNRNPLIDHPEWADQIAFEQGLG
jgi:endonuclease G, mitochondrial